MKKINFVSTLVTLVLFSAACTSLKMTPNVFQPTDCPADCKVVQIDAGPILGARADQVEINWGDGTPTSVQPRSAKVEHTYTVAGTYTIHFNFLLEGEQMGDGHTIEFTVP